jgi:glycine dehydrogenase subunit 2
MSEPLIFEKSRAGRRAFAQAPAEHIECEIPREFMRDDVPHLPHASELQVVRHYTRLSQKNFSIDTQFYPLGSCTMKYNPRACNALALLPGLANRHPLGPVSHGQGFLACMYELQEMLKAITGMQAVSLTPMAGAQGELAGVEMIRAYHHARGDDKRNEIIVPDAAHGTNPATATMAGCVVRELQTSDDGDIDIEALRAAVGPNTAGIMLTNPSTLGVFDRGIKEVEKIVHDAGGLLYYDGANLNAILGTVRPGDMEFDVIHMNLHKTFSTPHGGGGPGSGAVGVGERLLPYLPIPVVGRSEQDGEPYYDWLDEDDLPHSIGRLSGFMGNAGVLLRAYVYMRMVGRAGMRRIARFATLNANYLAARLRDAGFELAFPERRASHEFIITLKSQDYLLPFAGPGVPADRANRNREPRDTGRLRQGDDRYRRGGQKRPGKAEGSAVYDAGTAPRRRQGGKTPRSCVAAGCRGAGRGFGRVKCEVPPFRRRRIAA